MKYTEPELQILATRVDRLETQNRRWKLASTLLGIAIVGLLLTGAKSADRVDPKVIRASVVEAEDFILKDEDGHVHARLSLGPGPLRPGVMVQRVLPNGRSYIDTGGPSLRFYNERGEIIWTAPQTPTLVPAK